MNLSKIVFSLKDSLLANEYFRYHYSRFRYLLLKRQMRVLNGFEGHSVVAYNMDFRPAAFGCGGRMAMLLHPLRGFLFPNHQTAKVLIVGPRTEDDVIWARSIGLHRARGLDLFSYSPLIDLGDAHQTCYPDDTFDAVILGWVLPYLPGPRQVAAEMSRILIGFGWEYCSSKPDFCDEPTQNPLTPSLHLNTRSDLENLIAQVGGKVFCAFDCGSAEYNHQEAIFFKVSKPRVQFQRELKSD